MTSSAPRRNPPPSPRSDGRRERWREHREVRRAELIAAVFAAVEQRGAGVGMDDISAATGIAKPVFYRYFADKADLFRAVGREVAEAVVSQVTAAIDAEEQPRAKLAAGIHAYVRGVEARPELYRFAVANQYLASSGTDPLGDYASVVGRHATVVIGDFMRAAGRDAGVAEPWGFAIVGMVRSATAQWLETRSMSRAALVDYLTDLVWPGLAAVTRRPEPVTRPSSPRTPPSRHARPPALAPVRTRTRRAGGGGRAAS